MQQSHTKKRPVSTYKKLTAGQCLPVRAANLTNSSFRSKIGMIFKKGDDV